MIGMDQQSRRKCVLVNKLKDDGCEYWDAA